MTRPSRCLRPLALCRHLSRSRLMRRSSLTACFAIAATSAASCMLLCMRLWHRCLQSVALERPRWDGRIYHNVLWCSLAQRSSARVWDGRIYRNVARCSLAQRSSARVWDGRIYHSMVFWRKLERPRLGWPYIS